MVLAVARAENDELNVTLQEILGDLSQQVPALLRIEAADLCQQRDVGPLGSPADRWSHALQAALPTITVAAS